MTQGKHNDVLTPVANYYSAKLAEHGETPRGVDWNGHESQQIRFEQLSKIISRPDNFSINDLGCGYGALYAYLKSRYSGFQYFGFDIADDMIAAASSGICTSDSACFSVSTLPDRVSDYGVASGIFNVRLACSEKRWQEYVEDTIDILDRTSERGFSFNCLTSYSDEHKKRAYLYYADPCRLFDLCKRKYSQQVALLHDYGLYEFTILVRKQS